MRGLPLLFLFLLVIAAGCAAPGGGTPTSTSGEVAGTSVNTHPAQVEVFNKTLDFSTDPSGAPKDGALNFPAWAGHFTFAGMWHGSAPVTTTNQVKAEIHDRDGNTVAGCSLDTNVATQQSECSPKTNNGFASRAPYKLVWSGFGDVQFDARVSAQS